MVDGKPKFPLCWTNAPVAVMGYEFIKMAIRAGYGVFFGEVPAYGPS
jgi:hypothetical protein